MRMRLPQRGVTYALSSMCVAADVYILRDSWFAQAELSTLSRAIYLSDSHQFAFHRTTTRSFGSTSSASVARRLRCARRWRLATRRGVTPRPRARSPRPRSPRPTPRAPQRLALLLSQLHAHPPRDAGGGRGAAQRCGRGGRVPPPGARGPRGRRRHDGEDISRV
ncbi:hypothetical protein C8J57DRAFT_1355942, partial [Mycena rebaudengoi]